MIYIFFSVIIILISLFLFRKASGFISPNRINMLSFIFYVYFILLSYIGSIIVLLYPNEFFNRLINQINNESTKLYVWLALSYMLIMFPIGLLIAKRIMKINNVKFIFNNYFNSKIEPFLSFKDSFVRIPLYILSIISVMSMIYVYYSIGIGNFLSMFNVESQIQLLVIRSEMSNNFQDNVIINIFGLTLLPILSFISYSYYYMTKAKKDLMWFVIMFLSTFLFLIHDFQKSPFIIFLTGFLFLYILNHGKVKWKTIFILFFSFILFFFIIYGVVVKNVDMSYMLSPFKQGLTGRILISEISSLYCHFELFPDREYFLGISSMSRFIDQILNIEYLGRSGRIVLEQYAPSWVENGYGGVFNTIFLGEAWANFGLLGVLLSPLWTGFLIGIIYYTFLKLKKTPLYLGLFTYFSYKTSIGGGINDYIYNSKLMVTIFIIVVLIYFSKGLKQMYSRKRLQIGVN